MKTKSLFLISLLRDADGQGSFNDLTGFSLSPPYFNLAAGSSITATATCGQDEFGTPRSDLYCKLVGGPTNGLVSHNIQGQYCDYCNAIDPNKAHPVTNAIDGTERWWQSPPLSRGLIHNEVNVTLDLGQLFHVAYILIKFANAPRPDLWVLERSVDNGRTFSPWQYFAHSKRECIEKFGKQPNVRVIHDDDQLCTTEYSRIVPLENGEIVVSLVNGRPGSKNFTYSPTLRDFTKATNIRLRFLRTSTLLGHLISKAQRDPTVTRRYYYSIKDISIGGRCVCHGHAQVCDNPQTLLQCECQHNTCGESCDRCCPGFNQKPWRAATVDSPNECHPCQCFSHAFDCYYDPEVEKRGASLDTFGRYDGGGVCISCQHNTAGVNCERCIEGFYRPFGVPPESPTGCIPCRCDERTAAGCEMGSGRCICKPQFTGENCDRCADGYYYYPQCIRYPVYQTTTKSPAGPIVGTFCICDYRGTAYGVCDASGRCLCRQGVEGERCDRCRPGYHSFPNCQGCQCSQEGSYSNICNPVSGQCLCLPGVVGQQCDRCASGLRFPQSPISVCNQAGTEVGSCGCLPNVEGTLCDRCKPLYWNLAANNPRGCIECQCDVKGTLSGVGECEQKSGQCHCKPNACGDACDTCKDGYFLLQKKQYFGCQGCQCDVGGAVDMACDEMSGQCRCRENVVGRRCTEPAPSYFFPTLHQLTVEIEDGTTPNARPVRFGYDPQEFPDFSWRGYAVMSPAQSEVRVTVHVDPKDGRQHLFRVVLRFSNPSGTSVTGSDQSKEVIFPESPSPSFLTVPGEGFAEPFALTPGKWIIHIQAEGVLLDYLVLLPRDYYEAPLLQEKITQPCTYLPSANRDSNCLLYKHVAMDGFSSALGSQGKLSNRKGRRRRQARVRRLTPDHPEMAAINGRQVEKMLQLGLRVPRPGPYVLVLEYASEVDTVQNVNILISGQSGGQIQTRANIYSCAYSFLCRSVAVDSSNHVSVLQLSHKTDVLLQTSTASFLLYKVYAVPAEEFSIEYVDPKVLCVSTHATSALTLISISPRLFDTPSFFSQTEITFTPREPLTGRYVVVVHYHQPEHPSFPVEVRVNAGREWKGKCGREWQDYILLVPDSSYTPDLLKEKPLDKSTDFIQQCRGEGFYIDPRTSSQFCRDSARSLAAAHNDGALPCNCDKSGSTGAACDPVGGQCPCRQHVIGRQCTKCATGYYGFPYCRPCECGRRLCDEVTGRCICPPQTVKPSCEVCQTQTFSYHPLLGCEGCGCSPNGIKTDAGPDCDRITGQCSCKPRIGGRQCDRCAPGYYRFPECVPCNCNQGGVTPGLCHPDTGRCLCKVSSFYFDPSNLHGCTSCFCFGATDQCQSSSKRRGKFVDMQSWRLESPDKEEVTSVLNTASNTVVADIQELSPTVQTLHWVAPSSYLGDRVSSYGGFLTYQSKSFGIPSEGMTLMDRRPDVVLTGQDMTLIHMASQVPLPDRLYQGRVQLLEGNWRHAVTNRPVSREELMMVLAGLVGLRIRALYFTQSQRLSLGEVGLEGATNTGTGSPGNTVEDCSCPPQYTGDSCEKCAPGFYRDNSGPFLGGCVPCECNGLSAECEDGTGRCLNCKYNTAGDRCERCEEGYYGNAAQRTCRVCPCPFSVFAIGCREVFGDFQCICKAGYTGEKCESCAPGYYGDPLVPGGSCRPCNCNGNGNSCDPKTGVCKNTLEPGDTNTDESCQECDNCAQTLLKDLEKLDDELHRIKAKLDNASASSSSQERLRDLEKAVTDTKVNSVTGTSPLRRRLLRKKETRPRNVRYFSKFLQNLIIPDVDWRKSYWSITFPFTYSVLFYLPVLDYIKANVSKQCDQNEAAAKKIRGLLEGFEDKLKDLDEALKNATNMVKKANSQNGLNAQALESLQEYEKLAAQLDGAKTDLTKKVNEISKAAAQEDIVEAAEEHAKNLKKLAEDLENTVKNASGRPEVRNAKDAIDAYKNITDAINAAEAAANEAKKAADSALNNNQLHNLVPAVKNLLNTIPTLNDKISEVENLTSQFSPVSNITENIKKIKELIEQARDAANRIVIPMKFKGDGYVELRAPKNMEDLKAYTALSLSLQRPEGRGDGRRRRRQTREKEDMFVLYLGNRDTTKNYIGMVLRENVLYGVYKLNGVEHQMKTGYITKSPSEPAKFDRVDLQRIYQDAKMVLTKDITSPTPGKPVESGRRGDESKNLLDLSPSDIVFYVGGYPSNFTPPDSLNYPMYKGCIEFSSFNDKVVSLYNFKKAEKINSETPCKRYVPPIDSSYYEGTGYGKVVIGRESSTLRINLDIHARSENGLLFFIESEVNDRSCGYFINIMFSCILICTIRKSLNTSNFKEFYIGGIPQDLRERVNITMQPFKGCLRNLKLNSNYVQVAEQVGVSKGCPMDSLVSSPCTSIELLIDDEDKGQQQSGGPNIPNTGSSMVLGHNKFKEVLTSPSHLTAPFHNACTNIKTYSGGFQREKCAWLNPSFREQCCSYSQSQSTQTLKMVSLFTLPRPHFSLDVRTRAAEGLLFFATTRGGRSHLALYISKGRIRLSVGRQKEIFNREKYNDGKWHSVIFSLEKKKFRLVVDGIRAQDGQLTNAELTSMQQFVSPVYLGSSKALPKQSVSGCIRNFKMNGAPMSNPATNHGAGPCFEGQTQRGAYFSGNGAHVIISDFELLFSIRPRSLTGLLLHVGDSSRSRYGPAMGQYLIVYMLGGEVRPRSVVLPAQSGLGKHISWLFVSFNHSSQSTALMLYCMFSILMF
uniref:Laminin subunit alpha 3 n=1 Tax=Sparus aurata TaxID=8175 RepID=A0A671YXW3_SPAAU